MERSSLPRCCDGSEQGRNLESNGKFPLAANSAPAVLAYPVWGWGMGQLLQHRDTGEVLTWGGCWQLGGGAALGMQLHCSWGWAAWKMGAFQAAQHPGSAPAASRCDGLASALGAQQGLPHRWPPATPQNCLLTALATSQKAPTTLQRGSASAISQG